jgi:hypothetical protein
MSIEERTELLREFGETCVTTELTISDIVLIAAAVKLASRFPDIIDSKVVLKRFGIIVDKLRAPVVEINEKLESLFEASISGTSAGWPDVHYASHLSGHVDFKGNPIK